ncbi:MAG: hypothetical protein KAV82_04225 [Phycisphaerae bacterium]|nr:hypothetical protein [Phycisphaerae bacterium]
MKPDDPDTLLAGAGSFMCAFEMVGAQEVVFGGAYLSSDGGESWQEVISADRITAVEFCEQDPSIAYAGSAFAFYRSTDGGFSWQKFWDEERQTWGSPGISPGVPVDIQTDPADCNRVFINNYAGGNFLSTDGGQNWAIASEGYTGADPPRVFIDPQDSAYVITITRMAPFASSDGGESWETIAYSGLVAGGEALGMDPTDPEHLLVDSGAMIYETRDGGQNWSERHEFDIPEGTNTQHKEFVFAPSDPDYVYVGSLNTALIADEPMSPDTIVGAGIYRSTDGGTNWTRLTDPKVFDSAFVAIAVSPTNPQTVYAAGMFDIGVFKSTDAGETWEGITGGLSEPYGWFDDVVVDPSDDQRVFLCGSTGLYRSMNGGQSWEQLAAGLDPNVVVSAIAVDPSDSAVVYVATALGVYCSTDGGDQFQKLHQGLDQEVLPVAHLSISFDGSVLYAASIGIYRLGTPAGMAE